MIIMEPVYYGHNGTNHKSPDFPGLIRNHLDYNEVYTDYAGVLTFKQGWQKWSGCSGFGPTSLSQKIPFLQKASNKQKC